MTAAPRCRYNLDSRCPTDGLLDRIAALEVAARGYRERAERAEARLDLFLLESLDGSDADGEPDDCPVDGCEGKLHHYHRTSTATGETLRSPCNGEHGDCDDDGPTNDGRYTYTRCYGRPVGRCEAGSPGDALGDTPGSERPATGIVSAAHYGRMGA